MRCGGCWHQRLPNQWTIKLLTSNLPCLDVVLVVVVGAVLVVSGCGGHGHEEMSGYVGPLTQLSHLHRRVGGCQCYEDRLGDVAAVVQHVAGGVVVSEPPTVRLLPALHLAGGRALREPVVGHDVVLRQLAGAHLIVS